MPTAGCGPYVTAPRKRWRYPGVPIPYRLQRKYWDYSKGKDPSAGVKYWPD